MNIPFIVSARTARLIGRENVATSKGAIIELVKNGYDADASYCLIFFDNYYADIQKSLSKEDYDELISAGVDINLLDRVYSLDIDDYGNDIYQVRSLILEKDERELLYQQRKLTSLYIIDSGDGMTKRIITRNWMTIGTDDKVKSIRTRLGRVKTGAKGIGRFALDRLGSSCELYTKYNSQCLTNDDKDVDADCVGYQWSVIWDDFEREGASIDQVTAQLLDLRSFELSKYVVSRHLPMALIELMQRKPFTHGTVLKISGLRDDWSSAAIDELFSDLEILVPPFENDKFSISLFCANRSSEYGPVKSFICDDYDYKITAVANEKQQVKVTVIRKEQDVVRMPPELFKRTFFSRFPYREEDFHNGEWEKTISLRQLLPSNSNVIDDNLKQIGSFDFSFYFLKKSCSIFDTKRFFYKEFNAKDRQQVLNNYGGIKLFRDNFRVRPYGELGSSSFDWLGLGIRKSKSPAGVAKKGGGYKVEPDNVIGYINISRLTNINFEDKSSREGLQENNVFVLFKQIICNIIAVFEKDRASIAEELKAYDDDRYGNTRAKEKAKQFASQILSNKQNELGQYLKGEFVAGLDEKDVNLALLAQLNKEQEELISQLHEEQKILRVLASSGIVLAAFSHDLSQNNINLITRYDTLKYLLTEKLNPNEYVNVEDRKNPFKRLDIMQKDDVKLSNWLQYSLNIARKDRRKRRDLMLYNYFQNLKKDWECNLTERGIKLNVENIPQDLKLRSFEIDFDSIFHNLLVNSVDAFIASKDTGERNISISATATDRYIVLLYEDSGPGLSKDILDPNDIFKPLFTTKRNMQTGEESGTGLGMWILKSIVDEYKGNIDLLFPKQGFAIKIYLPFTYQKESK